jgi:hypothetical protein
MQRGSTTTLNHEGHEGHEGYLSGALRRQSSAGNHPSCFSFVLFVVQTFL